VLTRRAAWAAAAVALLTRRGAAQVLRPPGATNLPSPGVSLSLSGLIVNEAPTGTPNGTLREFSLAHTPITGTLAIYRNGMRQKPGLDYNASGPAITFAVASTPQTDDVLLADYWHS